ncbi:hypothetical protein VTH06DRAFT_8436 [Thermothelomyces fergusii]
MAAKPVQTRSIPARARARHTRHPPPAPAAVRCVSKASKQEAEPVGSGGGGGPGNNNSSRSRDCDRRRYLSLGDHECLSSLLSSSLFLSRSLLLLRCRSVWRLRSGTRKAYAQGGVGRQMLLLDDHRRVRVRVLGRDISLLVRSRGDDPRLNRPGGRTMRGRM